MNGVSATFERGERSFEKVTKGLGIAGQLVRARRNWRHPLYMIHAVTSRCNARCGFCAWNPEFYEDTDDLTTAEIKKLYLDARAAGFFALSMWGGEPLMRKDIGEIAAYAKDLGFLTNMVTNGALLERKMDEVVPHIDRLCISVDHPSAHHDVIRGVKGLWGKILSATLKIRCKYPHQKIVYVCTLQKDNVDPSTVEEMAYFMRSLNVIGVFNAMRLETASDDCPQIDIGQYNPTNEQLAEAFHKVRDLKKRGFPILNSYTHIDKMTQLPMAYRCHWPKLVLPIEANGDVVNCMHWGTQPIDNVRRTELSEILESPTLRALGGEEGEGCHKCVGLHRISVSEVWEGRFEPLVSWGRKLF